MLPRGSRAIFPGLSQLLAALAIPAPVHTSLQPLPPSSEGLRICVIRTAVSGCRVQSEPILTCYIYKDPTSKEGHFLRF